jgi:hypothetical protein
MIITIPSLIAAGIATAVVTGGITGTAVYLTAGDADVVTGNQIKTEGGLHILELGHMEPWAIAMMCATVLIRMGTWGACCHKKGKSYVREKETKLRDRALGRAKELAHMNARGAEELLQDVQTYHDLHQEIVVQKMHQVIRREEPSWTSPGLVATHSTTRGTVAARDTLQSGSAARFNSAAPNNHQRSSRPTRTTPQRSSRKSTTKTTQTPKETSTNSLIHSFSTTNSEIHAQVAADAIREGRVRGQSQGARNSEPRPHRNGERVFEGPQA